MTLRTQALALFEKEPAINPVDFLDALVSAGHERDAAVEECQLMLERRLMTLDHEGRLGLVKEGVGG